MSPGFASEAPARPGADAVDEEREFAALRPRLLRWALALGAGPDAAEDLVQETLLAAHRHIGRFDPARGSVASWTAEILVRRLRNRRRSWRRRVRLAGALRVSMPRSEPAPSAAIEARLTLRRLLEALTERQREVVALYEIAELSAEETARALGLTPAGVRSIARDAREKLSAAARGAGSKEDAP